MDILRAVFATASSLTILIIVLMLVLPISTISLIGKVIELAIVIVCVNFICRLATHKSLYELIDESNRKDR